MIRVSMLIISWKIDLEKLILDLAKINTIEIPQKLFQCFGGYVNHIFRLEYSSLLFSNQARYFKKSSIGDRSRKL